jgi:mRNA interferase MazF
MKRGDVVTVAIAGDYGKPRPAVVIQSDALDAADSVLVCLMTSTIVDAPIYRLPVEPTPGNGLQAASQIMTDKILAVRRAKCGERIGALEPELMIRLNHMLSVVIGLAD